MDTIREKIALNIKCFRIRAGMSVDEVGKIIGKSGKTVSSWEVGRGQPDADMLIELCRLFHVDISDFYGSHTTGMDVVDVNIENSLIKIFRTLDKRNKILLLAIARDIKKSEKHYDE